jgi:hypothetical protein
MPKTENRLCDAENDELMRVIKNGTRLNLSHSSRLDSSQIQPPYLPRKSIKIPRSIRNDPLTPSAFVSIVAVAATRNRCTRPLGS